MSNNYKNVNIRNKKAYFNYEIVEEFIAGIQLAGTEIKSLRLGKASLVDCYCYFSNHELFTWVFSYAAETGMARMAVSMVRRSTMLTAAFLMEAIGFFLISLRFCSFGDRILQYTL